MQKHVHKAEASGIGDDLVTSEGLMLEIVFLHLVQRIMVNQEIVGCEKESACTTSRVGNCPARCRPDTFYHCLNKCAWCEILPCTGLGIFCILFQQPFIDVAFHVRTHCDPLSIIHHVYQT